MSREEARKIIVFKIRLLILKSSRSLKKITLGATVTRHRLNRWKPRRQTTRPLKFSPFQGNRLAVASSSNFGIVGNGQLFLFNTQIGLLDRSYDTQDGLFDVC